MVSPAIKETGTVMIYNKNDEPIFVIKNVIKVIMSQDYTSIHFKDENEEVRRLSTNMPFVYYE